MMGALLPSSTELSYFISVADTQNISRAAERLGISQPTLSLAIQRLETSLGANLLIRTKSGVRLTHAGRKLLVEARGLVADWERIRNVTVREETEIRGRYIVGCHPSVALYALPYFLPELVSEYPELEVKLVHDLSRRITEDVISFKIDFGIVVNPWKHPDLVIKTLTKDEVTFWVGPGKNPHQDPYSGDGILICDPDLVQSQTLLRQIAKSKMVFKRTITSSNLEVIAEMVADGVGVGILPGRVASRLKGQKLKRIGKKAPIFNDTHALIYRADAQRSHASRSVGRWIESHIISGTKTH